MHHRIPALVGGGWSKPAKQNGVKILACGGDGRSIASPIEINPNGSSRAFYVPTSLAIRSISEIDLRMSSNRGASPKIIAVVLA